MVKIMLYEEYGQKFYELGPNPIHSKDNIQNTKDVVSTDEKENKVKYNNYDEIKNGDIVEHKIKGFGKVIDIKNTKTDCIIHIRFFNTNLVDEFYADVLIKYNFLVKVLNSKYNNINNVPTSKNFIIEEEEEEEDDVDVDDDVTEEELLETKLEDFFNDKEMTLLVSLDDIINYKTKIKSLIQSNFNQIKDKINLKRLENIEILEKYFNHLSENFKDKKIFKFTGQIPYDELWDIRKKYKIENRIDDLDEYIKTGFIFYWIFKDSVVFKTI